MLSKQFKILDPVETKQIKIKQINPTEWRLTCILGKDINSVAFECTKLELYSLFCILREEYQSIHPSVEFWEQIKSLYLELNDPSSLDVIELKYSNRILFDLYEKLKNIFKNK